MPRPFATHTIGPADAEARLDRTVRELLIRGGVDASTRVAREHVESKRVRVDGRIERKSSFRVRQGMRIEIIELIAPPEAEAWMELEPERVVFEDDWMIAIDKPAGLPSDATRDPRRDHAVAALTRLLRARGEASPRVRAMHRLDRDTTGVLVFSRATQANKPLTDAFRDRTTQKRYAMVVALDPDSLLPERWRVENHLDWVSSKPRRMGVVHSGGKPARTRFECVAQAGGMALVRGFPETGRTHQLRVHILERSQGIVGDPWYGHASAPNVTRTLLHAESLTLPHPSGNGPVTIQAPIPDDMVELAASTGLRVPTPGNESETS